MNGNEDIVVLMRLLREIIGKLAWFFFLAWATGIVAGAVATAITVRYLPVVQDVMKGG